MPAIVAQVEILVNKYRHNQINKYYNAYEKQRSLKRLLLIMKINIKYFFFDLF